VDQVVTQTDGFTGADLKLLLSSANQQLLLTRNNGEVEGNELWVGAVPAYSQFLQALQEVKPSVSAQEISEYMEWFERNKM